MKKSTKAKIYIFLFFFTGICLMLYMSYCNMGYIPIPIEIFPITLVLFWLVLGYLAYKIIKIFTDLLG